MGINLRDRNQEYKGHIARDLTIDLPEVWAFNKTFGPKFNLEEITLEILENQEYKTSICKNYTE